MNLDNDKNFIIYAYAKNDDLVEKQINDLKAFAEINNLNIKDIYIDSIGANKLDNKYSLKKLLNENSNINILIKGIDRLSRDTIDVLNINKLCKNKNIKFFDILTKQFIFDETFEIMDEIIGKILDKGSDKELQRNIDVLYIEPNKLPVKKTIKNTLEEKQKLVGGYIEYTYLEDCDDVAIVCNEESKINGMSPNRDIGHDIVFGSFFIVGDDPELGEDRSLTEQQIEKYSNYFGKNSIEKTKEKLDRILHSSQNDYTL